MSERNDLTKLPEGWLKATVKEVIEIIDYRGRTPPYNSDGIPHLRSSNIKNGRIIWEDLRYVSEETYKKYMTRGLPQEGDVLFTTEAPLGEVAIAPTKRFSLAQRVMLLRPLEVLLPNFLLYQIMGEGFQRNLKGKGTGTTVTGVSSRNFKPVPIKIPPLAEQHRIVAKLEELFTKLDAGVEVLRKARAQLKRYRQSVLKAAVTGELTREWREAHQGELEPASELLARIRRERREKWEADQPAKIKAAGKSPKNDDWKKRYEEPPAPDTGDLPELPTGWTWAHLDQLLKILRNGIGVKPDADEGIPILRISALRPMSVNLDDCRYLHERHGPIDDYILEDGDLLFTRYNGNPALVGICGVVRNVKRSIVHPDKLIRGEVASGLSLPLFLQIVLNVGESREFIAGRARTTAGQTGISGGDLKKVPVPLAPLAEQQAIVSEVERLLSLADATEQAIEQSLKQAERLRQSILKQAFSGKLVPQDPSDEPAEVLLARIREERTRKQDSKQKPPRAPRKAKQAAQMKMLD